MLPHSASDNLSVTRINRLLRPLSVRCASLSALPAHEPTQTITYASKSSATTTLPPLSVPRAQDSTSWLRANQSSVRTAQFTLAISNVRQAYANVVQAAFTEHELRTVCPTLASMCAHIAGNGVSELDVAEDEQEQLTLLGELFETVPAHHRRWMLVSHATKLVLNSCAHHPTLLQGLLEATLPYDLAIVSSQILERVLYNALGTSAPEGKPLIAHLTQSKYLVDLLATWTNSGHTVYAFTQTLSSTLSTCPSTDIWTCRAMSKLLLFIRGQCTASLMLMLESLVDGIAQKSKESRTEDMMTLTQCLLKWTRHAFELFFDPLSNPATITLDFLNKVYKTNLHTTIFTSTSDTFNNRDNNSVFCLALVCARAMGAHSPEFPSLVSLLRKCDVRRSTFDTLVSHILDPVYDYNFKDSSIRISQAQNTLKEYAAFLVENELYHLEASLWLCALYYVEHPEAESSVIVRGSSEETAKWCRELVDLVDEAEKRAAAALQSPVKPTVPGAKKKKTGWEEVLGCYVRKSVVSPIPIPKVRPKRHLRHSLHSPRAGPKHKPLRRLSNFDTLLSDAQVHHRVLHSSKRPRVTFDLGNQDDWENHEDLASPCPPRKKIFFSPMRPKLPKFPRPPIIEKKAAVSLPVPSSDDALDLFACDTSPVKR